jgi:Zn-dependent protease with chaperone function
LAAVAWSLSTPLRHAASRRQERRADAFALALTGGADAFDTAIRRLASRNLAEESPSTLARWLFHAHPTVVERLGYTRAYRELKL